MEKDSYKIQVSFQPENDREGKLVNVRADTPDEVVHLYVEVKRLIALEDNAANPTTHAVPEQQNGAKYNFSTGSATSKFWPCATHGTQFGKTSQRTGKMYCDSCFQARKAAGQI